MPAARDDAAVDAFFRRFFVDAVGERHIAPAQLDDFLFVHRDRAELVHGARQVIFEVAMVRRCIEVESHETKISNG
jgi:hypothetical protein